MPGIYGFHHMVVRLEDFDTGVDCYTKLFPQGPSSTGENACGWRASPAAHVLLRPLLRSASACSGYAAAIAISG